MAVFSLVGRSQLETGRRIDAEYYRPSYLELAKTLMMQNPRPLKSLTASIKSFGAYSLTNQITYQELGIPFLRCVDVKEGMINFDDVLHISESGHALLGKSAVFPGQVLLTMSGSVGNAVVSSESWTYPVNSNQDIAKISPKQELNPYYLATFLNSKYGRFQTKRLPVGSVQQHIFLWQIGTIKIPVLDKIQSSIANVAQEAEHCLISSDQKYKEAQNLLLSELGLLSWKPQHTLAFVRRYSEVINAQRTDAEHFQPKYDVLLNSIRASANYCKSVRNFRTFNARGLQPVYFEDGDLKVITSKHILDRELDYDNFARTDLTKWNSQADARVHKNDILTYTTGANVGRTNIYLEDEKALASNHVNILRVRGENPLYVGFVLNSILGRLQVRQLVTGTAQAELYPTDIDKMIVPFIRADTQNKIVSLVEQSHVVRREAKALLEQAKRAVEIAIEEGEEQAMSYLQ